MLCIVAFRVTVPLHSWQWHATSYSHLQTLCCRMYHLATKHSKKNKLASYADLSLWGTGTYQALLSKSTRSSATAEKQRVSCPHGGGLGPPAHSPFAPSGYTYGYGRIQKPQRTYVKRAVRKAHFKMNPACKVILIGAGMNPERCVVVMCN